jgi:hypothetical protein
MPRINERRIGNQIFVEAVWIDPASGTFIRKGVVKVLDASTREDVTHKI